MSIDRAQLQALGEIKANVGIGRMKPLKLTIKEPSETEIQIAILTALGVQTRRKTVRKGVIAYKLDGIYRRGGAMFWRANAGFGIAGGRPVQGNPSGTADILGCLGGRAVALEVKTRKGEQAESQRHWQSAWEAAGGLYAIVRSVREAVEVVRGWAKIDIAHG